MTTLIVVKNSVRLTRNHRRGLHEKLDKRGSRLVAQQGCPNKEINAGCSWNPIIVG